MSRKQIPRRTKSGALGPFLCLVLALPAADACRSMHTELPVPLASPGSWTAYGGDPGGMRYAALDQINRGNVSQLEVAWTYRTGDVSDGSEGRRKSRFEATPVLSHGVLYFPTPFSRVIALDAETGREIWTHDPGLDLKVGYSESLVSRGVALWEGDSGTSPCGRRVFFATLDARLLALDAATGAPCSDFGESGTTDLKTGVGRVEIGEYEVTSAPAVVGDVVIVGSALGDNRRVEVERGTVRAFDVHSGRLLWSWDPIPRSPDQPGWETWTPQGASKTGGANAWSTLAADVQRGLVFIPTGSAAPDFYGGERLGDGLFADSVVALRAQTGEMVWHFQVVHHDLWDYDVASQPLLTDVQRDGKSVPAVVVNTKMGHIFVLHRETGEPLFPVEERPVPARQVEGEQASPTQPFPLRPPPLYRNELRLSDTWGIDDADRKFCADRAQELQYDGIFTPPSLKGTMVYPGFVGGANWGSAAAHPRGLLVVNINQLPFWVRLHPRDRYVDDRDEARRKGIGAQFTAQGGTPYGMSRAPFLSPKGLPCIAPPWGETVAVDLNSGDIVWRVPIGFVPGLKEIPQYREWGSPAMGGPLVTGGELVFTAGTLDSNLRALDLETGRELWSAELPAGGQATPMSYRTRPGGRQFVVIAAGGHGDMRTPLGDYLIAYALPRESPRTSTK